jgi:MOSC domain-containing protein YiiM
VQVISVNVGLPREVLWKGKTVTTGIFKEPVERQVMMRTLNLSKLLRINQTRLSNVKNLEISL